MAQMMAGIEMAPYNTINYSISLSLETSWLLQHAKKTN